MGKNYTKSTLFCVSMNGDDDDVWIDVQRCVIWWI